MRPQDHPPERRCVECDATRAGCGNKRIFGGKDCCSRCQHPAREGTADA